MADIDAVSQAQYYTGMLEQQRRLSQEKKRDARGAPVQKSGFGALLETTAQTEQAALSADIPGVAGLSDDEALEVLKDALDRAGDNLKSGAATEYFIAYKQAVTNFMKFVVSRNYTLATSKRRRRSRKWDDDSFHIIRVIDEKLERLAAEVLSNHGGKLALLAKIDEINGLLVDLIS
jgi:uncharacterized protein YaaR (DUF327 family)